MRAEGTEAKAVDGCVQLPVKKPTADALEKADIGLSEIRGTSEWY